MTKPVWNQYKNAWRTAPKKTVAKHVGGGGILGGLFGLGYLYNAENIRKAQEERAVGTIQWGKANSKEDWLDRSANFVRTYNPFVALTADRALEYSSPKKVDYDKHGWLTKNFPGTSEFINSYGRHLSGWGTMLERGGRRAVADLVQGYSNAIYAPPAVLAGATRGVLRTAGKLFRNNNLSNYGDKTWSRTLNEYKNNYNSWEDFADNSYSKDNYSNIAPEVYQSFRALEQPTATAANVIATRAALKVPGKLGTAAAFAGTLDDAGMIPGLVFSRFLDE